MRRTLGNGSRATLLARLGAPVAVAAVSLLLIMPGCKKEETHTTGGTGTGTGTSGSTATGAAPTTSGVASGVAAATQSAKNAAGSAVAAVTGAKVAVATVKPATGAATQPANKDVTGTVTFTQVGDGVKVTAHLMGLSPGKHGIHIHDKADLSAPDLASAGGHWDPDMHKQHGGPSSDTTARHAGDLGNVEADQSGMAMLDVTVKGVTVGGGGKDDVVGHSVVIHAGEDDLKSNPAGNSGGRVAAGVIELKK